jgi:hypothetical protein
VGSRGLDSLRLWSTLFENAFGRAWTINRNNLKAIQIPVGNYPILEGGSANWVEGFHYKFRATWLTPNHTSCKLEEMNSKYDLVSGKPFVSGTVSGARTQFLISTLGVRNIIRAPENSDFPEGQRHTGTCQLHRG